MHITLTVKMQASSKQELVEAFPAQVATMRSHLETELQRGVFGPPENVELRYLLIGGSWYGDAEDNGTIVAESHDPNQELQ